MHPELDRLATELWDFGLENSPSSATMLGDHRFDHLTEDYSEEQEKIQRRQLSSFADQAAAIDPTTLNHAEQVTREVMIGECRKNVAAIDSEIAEMQSDQLVSPHASLMHVVSQWMFPEPEHAEAYVERLKAIPTSLDQAFDRFRAAVRKGRPPARITVVRSLSMLDGYLASPPDADQFATVGGPQSWDGESAWRDELGAIVNGTLRPAFQRYRDAFESELLPVARPDDRCGLTWVEGGDGIYASAVTQHTGLELTPDEIHEIGMDDITVRLAAEYSEIGEKVFGTRDMQAIFDHLRDDLDLRFTSPEEIMESARHILARAKAAIGDWFGVLPKADCLIAAIPEFMAKDLPAAHYMPPAPDGSRPGTYFVNLVEPHERMKFQAEAIGYHEAIPGHHLQLAIAGELKEIPTFQRYMGATSFVEGWGLYAERLADEMGLYSSELQRLGMLSADSWRAGRLVVDTGMHAKGWSRDQAVDFLVENTAVARSEAEVEVDRYIGWPGQALAYRLGQREIFRLREKARAALGDRFDIKGFHDTVLTSGPVTMSTLEWLVDEWVAGQG
jgi:uncharacterized protein (DUF885 family)